MAQRIFKIKERIGNQAIDGQLLEQYVPAAKFGVGSEYVAPGGVQTIDVEDQGVPAGTVEVLNFTGAGVSVTVTGNTADITIPGGGGGSTTLTSTDGTVDMTHVGNNYDLSVDVSQVINNWTETDVDNFINNWTAHNWDTFINEFINQIDNTQIDNFINQWNEANFDTFINSWTANNWSTFINDWVTNVTATDWDTFIDEFITNVDSDDVTNFLNQWGGSKGDVIVHDGSDWVKLPVGTDGQVLKANSTAVDGIEWANITDNNNFGGSGSGWNIYMPGLIDITLDQFISPNTLTNNNTYCDREEWHFYSPAQSVDSQTFICINNNTSSSHDDVYLINDNNLIRIHKNSFGIDLAHSFDDGRLFLVGTKLIFQANSPSFVTYETSYIDLVGNLSSTSEYVGSASVEITKPSGKISYIEQDGSTLYIIDGTNNVDMRICTWDGSGTITQTNLVTRTVDTGTNYDFACRNIDGNWVVVRDGGSRSLFLLDPTASSYILTRDIYITDSILIGTRFYYPENRNIGSVSGGSGEHIKGLSAGYKII